jgi:hypothetical protein
MNNPSRQRDFIRLAGLLRNALTAIWLMAGQGWLPLAQAQPMSDAAMRAYLVQSICLDESGQPTGRVPADPDCRRQRPQTALDVAAWRKHDWPDRTDPREPADGYQASDSVIDNRQGRSLIVQTFDFGDTRRVFGTFDAEQGDGGQVVLLINGWASIAMTEDGGDGVQWFVTSDCRLDPASDQRYLGWLLFRNDVAPDRWRNVVTFLHKARTADGCPWFFGPAFTRYRSARIDFPFRIPDPARMAQPVTRSLDVVISEHYGGRRIAEASHLERFYFARTLGLIRWERWENPSRSGAADVARSAIQIARSGRCPDLAWPDYPVLDWKLVDCRTWTNLVRPRAGWSVADFVWPALDAFGARNVGAP